MPYYNMDMLSFFFDIGFRMQMPDVGDSVTGWHVNPYIKVPIAGGRFQAGLRVQGVSSSDVIAFSVPLGLVFGF